MGDSKRSALFIGEVHLIIESLCERKYRANGIMHEIQTVADTNASSRNRGSDCIGLYIDAPIPEPYPTEKLREFVDKWKEQNVWVQDIKMELSA